MLSRVVKDIATAAINASSRYKVSKQVSGRLQSSIDAALHCKGLQSEAKTVAIPWHLKVRAAVCSDHTADLLLVIPAMWLWVCMGSFKEHMCASNFRLERLTTHLGENRPQRACLNNSSVGSLVACLSGRQLAEACL